MNLLPYLHNRALPSPLWYITERLEGRRRHRRVGRGVGRWRDVVSLSNADGGNSEDRRDAPPKYDGRLAGPDPPTPDCRLPTTDYGLPTTDYRLWTSDCRPMDYRLASVPPTYVRDALDTAHRSGAQGGCSLESLGPSSSTRVCWCKVGRNRRRRCSTR